MSTSATPEPVIRQIVEAMRALAGPHPGFRHSRYHLFHAAPACIADLLPQPLLRLLPERLCHRQLSLACLGQAKEALPAVLSAYGANPALFPQQPQCSRQRRAIHGKAGAQPRLACATLCARAIRRAGRGTDQARSRLLVFFDRVPPPGSCRACRRTRLRDFFNCQYLCPSLCS